MRSSRVVQAAADRYLARAERAYDANPTADETLPAQPTRSELHRAAARAAIEDKQYRVALHLANEGLSGEVSDHDREAMGCLLLELLIVQQPGCTMVPAADGATDGPQSMILVLPDKGSSCE